MIRLSESWQNIIYEASKQWFSDKIETWDPEEDPRGTKLFYDLFIRGFKVTTPSEANVTIKMTKESFKNLVGQEAYDTIVQDATTDFMSWFYSFLIGTCCGVVFSAHMKPGVARYIISGQASAGITALIQPKMKEALMNKNKVKEVTVNDERVQEVSGV